MAAASEHSTDDANTSLLLLELRLRRLEFLLTGGSTLDGEAEVPLRPKKASDSVLSKLSTLQADLDKLRAFNGPAGDLIRDIESIRAAVPEAASTDTSHLFEDLSTKASIVLSHATLYPETASRLSSLQTLQIPPAEQSTKLAQLKSTIEQSLQAQDGLEIQVQDLRQRSARCLEWWVKIGVVGMGDLWEEWEERLAEIEKHVARLERRKKEQAGYI